MSSQGYQVRTTSEGKIVELQSIPITINYQMDVIARKRDDNDELTNELIFYFTNNPSMHVDILKSANLPHIFSIWFNQEIEDNSDIESHMSQGEYFRSTLTFTVPDARLWKTTTKTPYTIDNLNLIGTTDFKDSSKDYMNESIIINDKGDNS